jgi:hypothetical protein
LQVHQVNVVSLASCQTYNTTVQKMLSGKEDQWTSPTTVKIEILLKIHILENL